MKKISFFLGAAALMFAGVFTSCSKVDVPAGPATTEVDVEVFKADVVYDFAAEQARIAAGGAKPKNVNGNQNNGQGFYGWEKEGKTDSRRNDYKAYKYEDEIGLLPETCQVWRRSDRYDQDASWGNAGGMTCPADREYAIDGLEEGSVVVITYEAEEGKECIWAIGDGSSEEGGVVRATATIDGAEAVTGQTIIPSGTPIKVNTVTPAVKGTGYIVFKVKKNTIISKIEIGKIVVEKQTVEL